MRFFAKTWMVLWFFASAAGAGAQEKLVFSTVELSPTTVAAVAVLKAAYGKLDIDIDVEFTSGDRALLMSSTGAVDGEVLRIKSVGDAYPTLLRVDVPVTHLDSGAFVVRQRARDWTYEDLPVLRIGRLGGVVELKKRTQDYSGVWEGHSNQELFEMLLADRLDVVVTAIQDGQRTLDELGFTGIEVMEKSIESVNLYHYLHKKNERLVPGITVVLEEMLESGELETILVQSMDAAAQSDGSTLDRGRADN